MFAYIRGKLIAYTESYCIIETGGIGYKLMVPASMAAKFPSLGQEIQLHCSFVVREISHTLYAFLSEQERDLFEVLITLSGIGPKLALNIVGYLPFSDLQIVLASNNSGMLCKIPGIGKKSAERLLIELRDKLPSTNKLQQSNTDIGESTNLALQEDALNALINLGFTPSAAQKALQQGKATATKNADLSALITAALSHL